MLKKFLILTIFLFYNVLFSQESLDSTRINSKKFTMLKNPSTAILYSLILPGAGQIYNQNYWKAPLFTIGSGVLIYLIIDNNNKYNKYQALYDEVKNDKMSIYALNYKSYKEYYRDMRDQSAFYLAGVYILAAVDAYAGAHLFDFNVSDQVKLNITPIFEPNRSLINFKIDF